MHELDCNIIFVYLVTKHSLQVAKLNHDDGLTKTELGLSTHSIQDLGEVDLSNCLLLKTLMSLSLLFSCWC